MAEVAFSVSIGNLSPYFVHPLLRARDWQQRPEFERVCQWWKAGGQGICALLGIGGAGKTAIVERLLQVLPDIFPSHPDVPKRTDLPPPARLFVFSFYDAPNPDSFFAKLSRFVTCNPAGDTARPGSYEETLLALQSVGRCTLILDGLERVQDDGARGGVFGSLTDGRLTDLLLRVADGLLRDVSMMVTSRFPLAQLEERGSQYYKPIPVEEIDPSTAAALLRQRGVRGTDAQLRAIADECGNHALTVDLTGGYIAEFGGGDPATPLNLTRFGDEEQARSAEPTNARRRAVRLQEYRFARIGERYREAFRRDSDPMALAALALLERICLFRLGVDADMLASIFLGEDEAHERIAGPALASLTREQLEQTVDRLVAMKLLEMMVMKDENGRIREHQGSTFIPHRSASRYSIHPAVRDGFLAGLDLQTRRQGHEAAGAGLTKLLSRESQEDNDEIQAARLSDRPGENPYDLRLLDLLEEILYHTVNAGQAALSLQLYRQRIGGFRKLGRDLGDFERGNRICRVLCGSVSPRFAMHPIDWPDRVKAYFFNEWGLFLQCVGRLTEAIEAFHISIELSEARQPRKPRTQSARGHVPVVNLMRNLLQTGRLAECMVVARAETDRLLNLLEPQAPKTVRNETPSSSTIDLNALIRDCEKISRDCGIYWRIVDYFLGELCRTLVLLGKTRYAINGFAALQMLTPEARLARTIIGHDPRLFRNAGVHFAELQLRLGTPDLALKLLEKVHGDFGAGQSSESIQCTLVLADVLCEQGLHARARKTLEAIREWAIARDAKGELCSAAFVAARTAFFAIRDRCTAENDKPSLETRLRDSLEDGLRIARSCGYGILHIDLLLLRAATALESSRPVDAIRDLDLALDQGIHPPPAYGEPELRAASDGECGYLWGMAEGRHLRGETLLFQAAQRLGRAKFGPQDLDHLPLDVQQLVRQGREQLRQAVELWRQLRDPESGVDINPRGNRTRHLLEQVGGGVLTERPLNVYPTGLDQHHQEKTMTANERNQVFISYSHLDKDWLDRLQTTLKPMVRKHTIDVWADTRIKTGQKWKDEITQALARAKVAVLLVTQNFLASDFIADHEVPSILAAAETEGLTVVWVPVTASLYEEADIAKYQAAHDPEHPLDSLIPAELNRALVNIAKTIRDAGSS